MGVHPDRRRRRADDHHGRAEARPARARRPAALARARGDGRGVLRRRGRRRARPCPSRAGAHRDAEGARRPATRRDRARRARRER